MRRSARLPFHSFQPHLVGKSLFTRQDHRTLQVRFHHQNDGLVSGHLPHLSLHGVKAGKLASLPSAMPRHDFVPPILLWSEGDRGDDPTLLDALDKLIHILVQLHLEGMVREIVDLRERDIINARELVFLSLRVIHEKLIVPGQAQIDFLHVLQVLSPPS